MRTPTTATLLGIDVPNVSGVVGGSGAQGKFVPRGKLESIIRNTILMRLPLLFVDTQEFRHIRM